MLMVAILASSVLYCGFDYGITHRFDEDSQCVVLSIERTSPIEVIPYIDEKVPPSPFLRVCDREYAWNTDRPLQFKARVHTFAAGYPRRLKVRQVYG